jgi:hypothetical protein
MLGKDRMLRTKRFHFRILDSRSRQNSAAFSLNEYWVACDAWLSKWASAQTRVA